MLTALTETVLPRILFSLRFLQLIQSSIIQPPHGRSALNWKNRGTFLSLISTENSFSWNVCINLIRGVIVPFPPSAIAAPVLQREDSKADVGRWKSNNELVLHLAFI